MNIANVKKIAAPLIEKSEGRYLKAYRCPAGVLTVGVGSTRNVKEGMVITNEQADARLRDDMQDCIDAIRQHVKVLLTDNQAAALCSFIFNLGEGNFRKSTMLKKINAGKFEEVPAEFARWNKAGGKVLRGLVARRAEEAALWARDDMEREDTTTHEPLKRSVPTVINPENINAVAAVATGVGAMNLSESNPMAYALAIIAVMTAAVFLFYFIKRRGS